MNIVLNKMATQKRLSIISFSLFSAWLLSLPFEGQVLYRLLAGNTEAEGMALVLAAVSMHFIGLFSSGFFIKRQFASKMTMIASTVVCIAGSLIFFLPFSLLWYISIIAISFFAGLFVASWGVYFKTYSHPDRRLHTAADVIIYSNIIMIFINVLTVKTSAFLGLGISIILLIGALIVISRLEAYPDEYNMSVIYREGLYQNISTISKPFIFLCTFIFIITINSGLMYQVVTPDFAHYPLLVSYYWAVPYIVVLLILRSLPAKINQAYILYIAIMMIGLSYISFMWLDRSVASYLIIDTLMMGAFGVCDLFWWSILGNMLDYSDNPVQILGVGLSMNVLGILVGGVISNLVLSEEGAYMEASVIALVIIFSVLMMLPLLNAQLALLLKNHAFLIRFSKMEESEQDKTLSELKDNKRLTEKETEVVKLLLQGYTYKAVAENLFISENTIKFHIKNIYQKLNIKNKMELIKMFTDNEK